MDMYGRKSSSLPQKSVVLLAMVSLVTVSYFVLFGHLLETLRAFGAHPHHLRNTVLFGFNLVVCGRFLITLFVFLKRKIPLEETFSVPMAFALYLLGFPMMTLGAGVEFGAIELIGIALFCVGSLLNTGSELQRHLFKARPDNKGKLFSGGLFALSMHVNYFGDVLWVGGYACVTRNLWAALVPAFLFAFFYFFNIPKLDVYLAQHYGPQFEAYAKTTRRLVPFIL